jgi:hypothetical protein
MNHSHNRKHTATSMSCKVGVRRAIFFAFAVALLGSVVIFSYRAGAASKKCAHSSRLGSASTSDDEDTRAQNSKPSFQQDESDEQPAPAIKPINKVRKSASDRRQHGQTLTTAHIVARRTFAPTAAAPLPVFDEDAIMEGLYSHARTSHTVMLEAGKSSPTPAADEQTEDAAVSVATRPPPKLKNPAGPLPPSTAAAPVSIVIVSVNEVLLPKTIESILAAKSAELISEILIIDDFSDKPILYSDLPADPRLHIVTARQVRCKIVCRSMSLFGLLNIALLLIRTTSASV